MGNLDFVVDVDILISYWLSLMDDSIAWILLFLLELGMSFTL